MSNPYNNPQGFYKPPGGGGPPTGNPTGFYPPPGGNMPTNQGYAPPPGGNTGFTPPNSNYGPPATNYGPPGTNPTPNYAPPGQPNYGYNQPPAPAANYAPPGAPTGGNYGPPATGNYGPPANNINVPPINVAPPANNTPRGGFYPAGGAPLTSPVNGPPSGGNVTPIYTGPPSANAGPPKTLGGVPAPPKTNVQFFTPNPSGTPRPAMPPANAPPSHTGGPPPFGANMPPPPTNEQYGQNVPGGQQFANPGQVPPLNPGGVPMMTPPDTMGGVPMPGGMAPPVQQPEYPGSMYGAPPAQSMIGMPSAFDNTDPNQVPGLQNPTQEAPLPGIDEMDLSIQCDPTFLRSSVGKVLNTQILASQSRLPIGIVCQPMAGDVGVDNEQVEVVDFGTTGIVRCKRCRTYINPFVSWVDNGRRWRCNICGMLNDVPSSYFSHLDQNGQRRDKQQRPELSRCSVEFVAPGDYMVRPPQPPVYFFVIDVTSTAGPSGMIASAVNAIKRSLDNLPGSPRTQVGFITFDSSIHFYNLKSSLKAPQMLVLSDIADVIMPSPDDLLVNLIESRKVIDALLDSLPAMFQNNTAVQSCTGAALSAAKRIMQQIGGKLFLFQTNLPTLGEGALKPRENPRLLGTDKEHMLLNCDESWYKNNAIDFSRLQIAVDVFLFSAQYTDVANFNALAKYSSGQLYFYPGYFAPRDGAKFEYDLHRCLTRATAFEAVMRVRATRGLRISNFYGNFFIRGTDLLALPNCHADSVFAMDLSYEEPILNASAITVQAALLYTNSKSERRIRVHTMVIPVTNSIPDIMNTVDIDCAVNVLAKQSIDIALKTGLDSARQKIHQSCVEVLRAAKGGNAPVGAGPGQYGYQHQQQQQQPSGQIPQTLMLLPLYSMSLQKNLALRGGTDVRSDERAFFQHLLSNMEIEESKVFIYPRLFSIHDMSNDAGTSSDNADDCIVAGPNRVRLPAILNLSHERLTSDGIFLLENGYDLYMWIGRNANPAIINTLFGTTSLENVDISRIVLQTDSSDFSARLSSVIDALRSERSRYLQLHFIREGDGYAEAYFSRFLVEDRANFNGGTFTYVEYHAFVSRQISGMHA